MKWIIRMIVCDGFTSLEQLVWSISKYYSKSLYPEGRYDWGNETKKLKNSNYDDDSEKSLNDKLLEKLLKWIILC